MHRLRTTIARLRPFAATHTARSSLKSQMSVFKGGKQTFQPVMSLKESVAAEPFLNGTSVNYVEEMYYDWLEDPKNVHKVLKL